MKTAVLSSLTRYRDAGLLLLRLGLGAMMVFHGLPKLLGGPERWEGVGGAMGNLGIELAPTFWGLVAACSETFGGVLLALGLLFRPACLFLLATMSVAAIHHLSRGDGLGGAAEAVELGIVFLALLFVGPGRLSVDGK